jgi:hypothetical protein
MAVAMEILNPLRATQPVDLDGSRSLFPEPLKTSRRERHIEEDEQLERRKKTRAAIKKKVADRAFGEAPPHRREGAQPVPEAEESGGVARKWDEVKDATKKAFAFF